MKIIYIIAYPFWVFFAKTWLGGVLLICFVPIIPTLLTWLAYPRVIDNMTKENHHLGLGLVVLGFVFSPICAMFLKIISNHLEDYYKKIGYQKKNREYSGRV